MLNQDLLQRRQANVPRGVGTAMNIFVDRANDAEVWDVEGHRFIDFASGIAVLNVGHCHPRVIAAAEQQMRRCTHSAFQVAGYEAYIALTERLNRLAPIEGQAKTILFSTGAEAVENAVKIARAVTRRHAVIAFSGGFHGRSFMAMSLTGKTAPYKRGFGPLPGGVYHVPFPAEHKGVSVSDSLEAIESVFKADVAAEDVAAIIIEPVQGEGGFLPAPVELMQALRRLADEHGIVLIADEVQTGFARTGSMFGIEHTGIKPDLITVAKSLGGGFPLSGVVGRADLMDAIDPGGLGGTYAGSPVACAAALAVLEVIEEEGLCERANVLGSLVTARLLGLAGRQDLRPIANVRGPGSMIAFDLVTQRHEGRPDPVAAREVLLSAHAAGLILLGCGSLGESVRLLYPLTIAEDVLAEGLNLLEGALRLPGH